MTERDEDITFAGSQTVEASFVFPLITLAVIAIIWLCIFLYGKTALISDCSIFLEYACTDIGRNLSERELQAEASERISGYPYSKIINVRVDKKDKSISIFADVELNIPDKGMIGIFTKHIRYIHVEQVRKVYHREERQRLINLLL